MRNKLFTLFLAVLASIGMQAADYSGTCGNNLTWELSIGTGELIVSGSGEMANYTNSYYSYAPWHSYQKYIKRISIGEEVTSIGNYAFSGISNLTSISLPNGLERIGRNAFYGCSNLASISVGLGCQEIGEQAFANCSKLTNISIPSDIISFGINVFGGCTALTDPIYSAKQFFFLPFDYTGEYTIPNGIEEVCTSAFASCSNLTKVIMPNTVQKIGASAFVSCTTLTQVTLSENLKEIGNAAFSGCSSLSSLLMPAGVEKIGANAFYGCTLLTTPIYSNKVFCFMPTGYSGDYEVPEGITEIAEYAFRNCTGLLSVHLPNSVNTIGECAFYECTNMTQINIPTSVKVINSQAFWGCTQLQSIDLSHITKLGQGAFSWCSSLTRVTLSAELEEVSSGIFDECEVLAEIHYEGTLEQWCKHNFSGITSNFMYPYYREYEPTVYRYYDLYIQGQKLETAIVPNTIDTLYRGVFCGIKSLKYLSLSNTVKYIEAGAIRMLPNISTIVIPDNVERMEYGNLVECPNLTHITFGENLKSVSFGDDGGLSSDTLLSSIEWRVKRLEYNYLQLDIPKLSTVQFGDKVEVIPERMLAGKHKITSLSIPNSVKRIGNYAFAYCTGLRTIHLSEGLDSIGNNAFENDSLLVEIQLPKSVSYIASSIFQNCSGLRSVILPEQITELPENLFSNCRALQTVQIGRNVQNISATAFSGCTSIKSIIIPENVKTIGNRAFADCSQLQEVQWNAKNCADFSSSSAVPFTNSQITHFSLGDSVLRIPSHLCYNMTKIDSLHMPNSLTSIGTHAFDGCVGLKHLTIPDKVATIESYAFRYCTGLTTLDLGRKVKTIEQYALYQCKNITRLTCRAALPPVVETNNTGIDKSQCTLYVPEQSLQAYRESEWWSEFSNIQGFEDPNYECYFDSGYCGAEGDSTSLTWELSCDSVLTISGTGEMAGYSTWSREKIHSVIIKEGVTSIGHFAFQDCINLTSVSIPQSVTHIGAVAFRGCSSLTSIVIPANVTYIEDEALIDCPSLTSITFEPIVPPSGIFLYGVNDSCTVYVPCGSKAAYEEALSYYGSTINKVVEPEGCTAPCILASGTCGENLTWELSCDSVLTISGEGEMEISKYPPWYDYRDAVTSAIISGGITNVGFNAFMHCTNLLSVVIPETVTRVGSGAFIGCSSMPSIVLPKTIKSVGSNAFERCYNLNTITIPDSVTSIGSYAFYECKNLVSISLPSSISKIEDFTFQYCYNLVSIKIPNGVQSIGVQAFYNCTYLDTVFIPQSVTHIENYAFNQCKYLNNLFNYSDVPQELGNTVFNGVCCCTLYVPGKSIELYRAADQWKDFMNILPIPGTEVEEPMFRVTFLNWNGDSIAEQLVAYNSAAVAPELPAREGYIFKGWTADIEHITARTFAIALYDKVGVEVTYKAEDGDVLFSEHADLHIPDAPALEGKTFAGWLTENIDKNGIVLRATYTIDNPTTNDDVTVVPGSNSANVIFPFVTGAITYVLVIRDLFGHVVCKIMFNASGRLLGIAFAPSRESSQKSAQTDNFQFTVEGLDPSTTYEYEFVAHSETDEVIETLTGSFTTKAEVPTDIESPETDSASAIKVVQNDQVLILRGEKVFTITGQEVK